MLRLRLAAAWLLFVGLIWTFSDVQVMRVANGPSTVGDWVWSFGGPVMLMVAAAALMTYWCRRIAAAAVSISVAYMAWGVASSYWPKSSELNAIASVQYDWLFIVALLIVVLSAAAVFVIWRTLNAFRERR